MAVSVVIPFRGGCPERERALTWVVRRYADRFPSWQVVVGEDLRAGPWVKAVAVENGLSRARHDLIVVADGDVWTDGIGEAVENVQNGARWAIPHRLVHRLNAAGSLAAMSGADWRTQPVVQWPYVGFEGGGIVVLGCDVYRDVPLDRRFEGFSGEDESWAVALRTLVGAPWRGTADLYHIWHPPQERMSRRWGSVASRDLAGRFHDAAGDPTAMRALVEEVAPCPSLA